MHKKEFTKKEDKKEIKGIFTSATPAVVEDASCSSRLAFNKNLKLKNA